MNTFPTTEHADAIRAAVREFAAGEIAPLAAEIDRSNSFPAHLWKRLGDMGLLGITAADAYGGAGMGYLEHVIAMEEISRASASVGLSYSAHSNLCVTRFTSTAPTSRSGTISRASSAASTSARSR
jgi:isovaleryl-CoA dehydrogenase